MDEGLGTKEGADELTQSGCGFTFVGGPSLLPILRLQQVVDEGMGKNEGADELLSAFNVATFKSAEDDKAFWNRLIPADAQNAESDKKQVRMPQLLT